MKLDDIAIHPKTVREVINDVFAYDANTQIRTAEATVGGTLCFSHTITIEVPVKLAKEALLDYQGPNMVISEEEARLVRAQRAFNQNPTPAMATIIKRLHDRIQRLRKK